MTDPGADRKPKSGWPKSRWPLLAWLRWSVSLQTILLTFAVLGAAVAIFVAAGGVDVSADTPDSWLAVHGLHFVFKRSEGSRSRDVTPPADLNAPSRVRLGAQHFDMVCANCHGRPGFGQSVVALSMSPRPQYLPKVVRQFTNSELYLIVEHGVKYSAMPSWAAAARGDEVWSMVAFLRQLPTMDAKTYRDMTALPVAQTPAAPAGDAALQPANAARDAPPADEFLYAAPSAGFSDPGVHDNPAATCARCHGADGTGAATGGEAPNLTIQDAGYLKAALKGYVGGGRKSGYMQTIAAELSGAQIDTLAGYYASLPVQTAPAPPADPALVARGEAIATQGIRASATPACANCHESAGSQIANAPHIAGQSATFLRRQLGAMGRGGRGSTVMWNPMSAVAHDLGDKDIAALAAYYSSLKPAKAAGGAPAAAAPSPQTAMPAAPVKVDLAAAKTIFEMQCITCHLNGGRGDPQGDYPDLTLQSTTYAAQSLYAFTTRARLNGKMQDVTNGLTLDQLTSLAHYVGGLAPQPALARPDAAAAARGAAIAMNGAPDRGVPACLSCHGAKGVAALPLIPALQGQHVAYLRKRLAIFAKPYPTNINALNPMPGIASALTEQERADVAAYFAAAPPLPKATAAHP